MKQVSLTGTSLCGQKPWLAQPLKFLATTCLWMIIWSSMQKEWLEDSVMKVATTSYLILATAMVSMWNERERRKDGSKDWKGEIFTRVWIKWVTMFSCNVTHSVVIFEPQSPNGTYEVEVQRLLSVSCIPLAYSYPLFAAVWIRGVPSGQSISLVLGQWLTWFESCMLQSPTLCRVAIEGPQILEGGLTASSTCK